MYGHIVGLSY